MNTVASLAKKDLFRDKNITQRPKAILGNGSAKTPSGQLLAKRKVRYLEDLTRANESDTSPYKKRAPQKNPGIKAIPVFVNSLIQIVDARFDANNI